MESSVHELVTMKKTKANLKVGMLSMMSWRNEARARDQPDINVSAASLAQVQGTVQGSRLRIRLCTTHHSK